jgi:hypothetical protein
MYALLLPVLAVAAMAMSTGAAQAANPHWFICEKLGTETGKFTDSECQKAGKGFWEWIKAKETPKTQVITFGKLRLIFGEITIECKVIDAGNIWNTEAGGLDEITAFTNYECKATPAAACEKPEIRAEKLPWKTKLVAGPIDEIEGIQVTLLCKEAAVSAFTGTLKPTLSIPTEAHPLQATFTKSTGELTNGKGEKAKVEGKDSLITEEDQQVKVE